ncbi:MAG: DUF4349 domain-containing protein [Treponema sp.]|nr:DUF4349 domain-containing protein [Treponema sp.]
MTLDKKKIGFYAGLGFMAQVIIVFLFCINGCSGSKGVNYYAEKTTREVVNSAKSAAKTLSFDQVVYEDADFEAGQLWDSSAAEEGKDWTKKIIRNGSIGLEVESLSETLKQIENWVSELGGYISSSDEGSTWLNVRAHVPEGSFDRAMEMTGGFGKLVYKNISSRDVTDQYYDIETRLKNKRLLLEKLQGYLKEAKNVSEIMQVESKIENCTSEIESLQGQINRLSKEIDYSEIYINANLPNNYNESGFILPDTKSQFREFVSNIIDFCAGYFWVIFYILIGGTLCVLLAAFLFWLTFGKLGLVKKLFRKLK